MKGFGIEIKNTLLEKKHVKQMQSSVWLYMWLLDKITRIEKSGVGKVLGGKPIKYEEVRLELGIQRIKYIRWIARLVKFGYIDTKRTPYGLIFTVNKAYKRFGNRSIKTSTSPNHFDTSPITFDTSNKTEQLDRTERQEDSSKKRKKIEEISKELKSKLNW